MPDPRTLAERLRELREAAGLNYQQAAYGAKWQSSTIEAVELGDHIPGRDLVTFLAHRYNVSSVLLLALRDQEAGRAPDPRVHGPKDGPRLHCEDCGSMAVLDIHDVAIALRMCRHCGWRKMLRGSMLARDIESVVGAYQLSAWAAESARADEDRQRKEKGTDDSG